MYQWLPYRTTIRVDIALFWRLSLSEEYNTGSPSKVSETAPYLTVPSEFGPRSVTPHPALICNISNIIIVTANSLFISFLQISLTQIVID